MNTIDRENPWPGLAPFTEAQSAQFFGRDAEIKILARRVQGDPLTVLFGQSGLGKSSLLQAGVFPRLRSADFCPVYIRLDYSPGAPPLGEQVKQTVLAETARAGHWTKAGFAKPGESLWEFFHHRDNRLVSAGGIALSPVLVFDQFEELFTLGSAARSSGAGSQASGGERQRAIAFMTELAELVENRPPDALVARVEQTPAELDALDFGATDYRVVITLREDYLPHLESLKTIMPALMDNRMRLSRMNGVQALEAVVKPGGGLVTEEVARAIVEFVAGARGGSTERLAELDVEPPLLSIICRELNDRRRALGHAQITADLVTGNRREILTDFYERSVADLPEAMRTFVEDKLLTKSGFRDNLALEAALEEPGVTRPLIDTLVNRRLLRIEDRLGVERVELTHDVLAEVIRTSRDAHQQRRAVEQAQAQERLTRRRMWLARTIAAGLLVGLAGVSWVAWRAVRAEREQARLREDAEKLRTAADTARAREAKLRRDAESQELAAKRKAYASDMNGVQNALATDNLGRARELLNRHRPEAGQIDLRGWEWRYLWQFCRSDAQAVVQEPNNVQVSSVAVSADGNWLATGGAGGGRLTLYHLRTKEQFRPPAGEGEVRVAFSPRAPLLAIGSRPRTQANRTEEMVRTSAANHLTILDLATRKILWERSLPGLAMNGFSFTADGERLILGCGATSARNAVGEVSIWRVSDGTKLAGWPGGNLGFGTSVSWFAATRDGAAAAIVSAPNTLRVIDLATGQERWSAMATDERPQRFAFSPDGRVLASGAAFTDTAIRLWDAATGRDLGRLEGQRGFTTGLEFMADGKRLLSSSGDQTLRLWDLETRSAVRAFRGHKTEVHALAISPDERTLFSGCKDGSAYAWDLKAERAAATSGTISAQIYGWTFVGGSEAIVMLDASGRVTRCQGPLYEEQTTLLQLESPGGVDAVFDRQHPLVAVVTGSRKLQVWDWQRRVLVQEWVANPEDATNGPMPRAFLSDGATTKLAVTRGASYSEWDLGTRRETRTQNFAIGSALRGARRTAFSQTGTQIALIGSGESDSFRLDLRTGLVASFKLNVLQIGQGVAFSHDDQIVAVPSQRGYVRLFDSTNYREIATLGGYMFGVHSAAFSPDRQRLAVGSTAFEAMSLWDLNSHERLITLPARTSSLQQLEFSPDGGVLIGQQRNPTMGTDRALIFWRAPSWSEIEKAEAAGAVTAADTSAP